MTKGYSGTPLAKKLGIKTGFRILAVNAPGNYLELLEPLPAAVEITDRDEGTYDLVHFFTNYRNELFGSLPLYMRAIRKDGTIWVSWHKKAAKLPTEIAEDTVREIALPLGLVDVKVCAVDEKWSALKLVIRKENRS